MISAGTKSLLFGAHWPPHILGVALAWRWLYGSWPTWKEFLTICVHDIGNIGCEQMEDGDGRQHPELGAVIAENMLGEEYGNLIRGHSKGYAESMGVPLSKLYAPDKLAIAFDTALFYTFRTRITGELGHYRSAGDAYHQPSKDDLDVPDADWFRVVRARMIRGGLQHALTILAPTGLGALRGR